MLPVMFPLLFHAYSTNVLMLSPLVDPLCRAFLSIYALARQLDCVFHLHYLL
jgi:hypothetical protein